MIHTKPKSKYPFTATSSMLLGNGLRLGSGVVVAVNLFPKCGSVDYAQISYIGREHVNSDIGLVKIVDNNRNYICNIEFTIPSDDRTSIAGTNIIFTGIAKRYGEVCGVMVVTGEFMPLLTANYYPEDKALVLSPSAFFPQPDPQIAKGKLVDSMGNGITAVSYNTEYFSISGETASVISTQIPQVEGNRIPVTDITINGKPVSAVDGMINIMPKPKSGILITTDNDGIVVGGYRDL